MQSNNTVPMIPLDALNLIGKMSPKRTIVNCALGKITQNTISKQNRPPDAPTDPTTCLRIAFDNTLIMLEKVAPEIKVATNCSFSITLDKMCEKFQKTYMLTPRCKACLWLNAHNVVAKTE